MVRALLILVTLSTIAAAETPKERATAILKAQVAALVAGDDQAMIATFTPDAALEGFMMDEAVPDLHAFDEVALGGSPHNAITKHKLGPIAAGGNDQVVWYSADVTLTYSNQHPEERVRNATRVVRITGLATAASNWKVVAAMMDNPTKQISDATGTAVIRGATTEGPLTKLLASPSALVAALTPDAVVVGTELRERGIGPAAKKLVKGWSKLAFSVGGPPREVTTKDYAFTQTAIDWKKGDRLYRFDALAFALPVDGAWKVVAVHYSTGSPN